MRYPKRISNDDFDRVQKFLQAQRGGDEETGRRRVPADVVHCDGCGSRLVVKSVRGHRFYRCKKAILGDIRYEACRTLVRVPD